LNGSIRTLQNVLFLIRDWKPGKSEKKLGFGSKNGSKYIKNLLNSITELSFNSNVEDLYCYLMSEPELNPDINEIDLSKLKKQFILDLQNLVAFKLLDSDELQRNFKDESNEYMSADEWLDLIENCIKYFNENKDFLSQSENENDFEIADSEELKEEMSTYIKENCPNSQNNKTYNSSQNENNIEVNNKSMPIYIDKTKGQVVNLAIDQFAFNGVQVNLSKGNIEFSNVEGISCVGLKVETENDENHVQNLEKPENLHHKLDLRGKQIKNSNFDWIVVPTPSISDSKGMNKSYYDEKESIYLNNAIKKDDTLKEIHWLSVSNEHRNLSSQIDNKNSEDILNRQIEKSHELKEVKSEENGKKIDHKINSSKMNELSQYQSNDSVYHDCITYDSHISEGYYKKKDTQEVFDSEKEINLIKNIKKVELNNLIDSSLVKYANNIKFELEQKDVTIDIDFSQVHSKIFLLILVVFEQNFKLIVEDRFFHILYPEHKKLLMDKIEKFLKSYENEFKVIIQKYREVSEQSFSFFEEELESSLKIHITVNFNKGLNGVQAIEKLFEETVKKTIRLFKSSSENISQTNIEKHFLKELEDKMMKDLIKYQNILSYLCEIQLRRKNKFPNQIFISEAALKSFHESEKIIILKSIINLNDSKVTDFVQTIMQSVFTAFEMLNKAIADLELELTDNAIDLAYELYLHYFETKLKTGLFTPTQVDCIQRKVFEFTLKKLLESCGFNKDQKHLVEKCKADLKLKVEEHHENLALDYQKKFDATVKLLNKLKTNTINSYCSQMNARLSENLQIKSSEFNQIHHEYSRKAMEIFNNSTDFFYQNFDKEFAKKHILETRLSIRKNIDQQKINFERQKKDKSTNDVTLAIYLGQRFISAAIYQKGVVIILNKFGQKYRPNLVALENGIFFGCDAKNYLENSYSQPEIFDFKQLLGRKRKNVTNEELKVFPFNFVENKLSVYVTYNDIILDMSIESLLALLILDLKSEAEKQTGEVVQNIVLTYPTNYNLIKKNAIRNATKIAGIEGDSNIISELSAAAIGYARDKSELIGIYSKNNVLFVSMNDYECDVAVCEISRNEIKYRAYFNGTLDPNDLLNKKILSRISKDKMKNKIVKDSKKFKMKRIFKYILENILKAAKFKSEAINDWIIVGNSWLFPIDDWIQKYFCFKSSTVSNPVDIIINGCTIYGEMLTNKKENIEVIEVSMHNISFYYQTLTPQKKFEVLKKNEELPKEKLFPFNIPRSSDLPINIDVFQDEEFVSNHSIEVSRKLYERTEEWSKHDLLFKVNRFGDIDLLSIITNKSKDLHIYLDFEVKKSGLSEDEIILERKKIISFKHKIEEKAIKDKEKSLADKSKNNLIEFCLTVKHEVENDREMRSMIKKEILKEMDETLIFLRTDPQNLVAIENRKKILIKQLETYKFNLDLVKRLLTNE
jgi:molecular chaperone DnaK (HSP70)